MLEGRPRSWTKRPRGAPWSRGGRTWPGPTANWRPPRGSSTHGPTTSLRSPWCLLCPTPGLWLATHRRRSELGSGSERQANEAGAPAGFGKTTLLSEWVAGCERPAAWLSLDEGDNDPTRFLAYFVAALQTIAPDIGEGVLGVLGSPQPPPIESILTALLNEIDTVPDDFVLVLDDYHVIDGSAVEEALSFVLEHLPPGMHLVIATREDPQLPLARLRARGQL